MQTNRFETFARIFSRRHKETTFSDARFRGVLRVKVGSLLSISAVGPIVVLFVAFFSYSCRSTLSPLLSFIALFEINMCFNDEVNRM